MGRWKTCHKHMHMYQIDCKQCMREERDALRAKLGTAEHERDDARTELDELRGMFDTLEQRRVSDAKQLAAQAPVIAAAKELIRVWGDGERYGETWCEMRHSYACYMNGRNWLGSLKKDANEHFRDVAFTGQVILGLIADLEHAMYLLSVERIRGSIMKECLESHGIDCDPDEGRWDERP